MILMVKEVKRIDELLGATEAERLKKANVLLLRPKHSQVKVGLKRSFPDEK